VDFIDGIVSYAGAGHPSTKTGVAIHYYLANCSMDKKAFYNSDGDFLIVPQLGTLNIQTELGFLKVAPREICVIPRGIRFSVALEGEEARGYILELYQGRFELPSLGPIGANGLANPRDFLYPVAAYVDDEETYSIVTKFNGSFFVAESDHSPFDVVAWHGNYAPYKYDLDKFCCMNSVTYDHPDPSIYTVLTAPSAEVGTAVCDFVIFPPRWMVMEHSFRPPYYHRNCMSEFMGMIYGKYDAKEGFVAGGSSLHSCMTPHGPDSDTFFKASTDPLDPTKFEGGLAFMFESTYMFNMSDEAVNAPGRETTYNECWSNLPRLFDPSNRDVQVTLPGEEEKEG
jgi:homogentisate 1,2-dioxygenase